MNNTYEKLLGCLDCVRKKTGFVPDIAIVLGSGLGAFADMIKIEAAVDYSEIDGFPVSTVPGHAGRFVFGYVGDVRVVIMQGRVHYYEGYSISDVVLPVRLMGMMGAKAVLLTNASGSLNKAYNAGEFMLITDHILSFFPNPLIGANIEELGTRFPDMSCAYDRELSDVIRRTASQLDIKLNEGVYVQLTGPSFETPAEVRMLGQLGGDAVGMSTAVETVAARHSGMRVCGISLIANKGAGLSPTPLTHQEVFEAAEHAAPLFRKLVWDSVVGMGEILK